MDDDLALDHPLRESVGEVEIHHLPTGECLIKVRTKAQSLALQRWISSAPRHYKFADDLELNSSVGTVIIQEEIQSDSVLYPDTAPLIQENLSSCLFPVVAVETQALSPLPVTSTLLISHFSAETHLHISALLVTVFLLNEMWFDLVSVYCAGSTTTQLNTYSLRSSYVLAVGQLTMIFLCVRPQHLPV